MDDVVLLLDGATDAGLRRPSNGARWTNEQLMFHMLLGCAADTGTAVQSAPRWCQPSLRTPPQHATTPFDAVNYVGSCSVEPSSDVTGMAAIFDRVIRVLYRWLDT